MSNTLLQIERTLAGNVANGSNVIFNSVVYSSGSISYDYVTGVITFSQPGTYTINWWVATQTSLSNNGIVFSLTSSQGDVLDGNSPLKTNQVSGIGIIEVVSAPVTLSLINESSASVTYSSIVPIKASLMVVENITVEVGPTGPIGPTGATGATGATGPTGANANGTIIPFGAGSANVTTTTGGVSGIAVSLGFGTATSINGPVTTSMNLGGNTAYTSFIAPRNGTLTDLWTQFKVTNNFAIVGTTVNYIVQVYTAPTSSNTFTAIIGFSVNIPLTTSLTSGDNFSGNATGYSIPITAGTKIIVLINIVATGATLLNSLIVVPTCGLNIV